jgi:hypothetical protein
LLSFFSFVQWGDYVVFEKGQVISHVNISIESVFDGGVYSCLSSNRLGQVKHSALIRVEGSSMIREMKNKSSIEGESVWIPCYILGNRPPVIISWSKDGRSLPFNHRQRVLKNGSLEIVNLNKEIDAGKYTCSLEEKNVQESESPSSVITSSSSSSSLTNRKIAQQSMHLDVKGKSFFLRLFRFPFPSLSTTDIMSFYEMYFYS